MNRYYRMLLLLFFVTPLISLAQDKKNTETKENGIPTFEKFFKGEIKKIDSVIPVYTIDNTKYYIEISDSLLGRDMLISGVIVEGPWYSTTAEITDAIYFKRGVGKKLDVYKRICAEVLRGNQNSELKRALEEGNMQPAQFSLPIVATSKDGKGYIVDITADVSLKGDLFNFSNLKWVNSPEASKSGVDSIVPFKTGVKFISQHSQTESIPQGGTKYITAKIEWGIQLLPEKIARVRVADPRVGYATRKYSDYGMSPHNVSTMEIIRKWTIEVQEKDIAKYSAGELVSPKHPITIYLNNNIPVSFRPYVKRGIAEWERAFNKIGFKNVFVIKEENPVVMFAPHQISIVFNETSMERYITVSDPRDNEILGALIVLDVATLEKNIVKFIATNSACYPKILKEPKCPELRGEIIRWRTAYMMGFCLGLNANSLGSYAYSIKQLRDSKFVRANGISASIMDDSPLNFVAQPEDNMKLKDLFPCVSHYDYWAIEYGYKLFPKNNNEYQDKISLAPLLEKARENSYLAYSVNKEDYRVLGNDLSNDRIAACELGLKNLTRIAPHIEKASLLWTKDKEYMEMYTKLMGAIYSNVSNYNLMPFFDLAARSYTPIIRGYNDKAIRYVTAQSQKELMLFLEKVLADKPYDIYNIELYNGLVGKSSFEFMQGIGLTVTNNLVTGYKKFVASDGKIEGYGLTEFLADINRIIFKDFDSSKPLTALERFYQTNYLGTFINANYSKGKAFESGDDLGANTLSYIKELYSKFTSLAQFHKDEKTRSHYATLAFIIEKKIAEEPTESKV